MREQRELERNRVKKVHSLGHLILKELKIDDLLGKHKKKLHTHFHFILVLLIALRSNVYEAFKKKYEYIALEYIKGINGLLKEESDLEFGKYLAYLV